MRIIFAGRDNSFNRKYIKELFKDHEIVACLFLEGERMTWKGKLKKIRKRINRYGVLRVTDELAFQVYSRFFLRKGKEKELLKAKSEYFYDKIELDCPVYDVRNIHSEKWIDFIKEQKPDLIFSICCNVIFKEKLYNIPKYGTFVLHEGITPEYKGLHTPIWALVNKDHDYLGYTVLKVNDKIDGGEVLDQGKYELKPGENIRTWSWIGHNALIEGMPKIRAAFERLAEKEGNFTCVNTQGRESSYYTWIPLTKFLKKRLFSK